MLPSSFCGSAPGAAWRNPYHTGGFAPALALIEQPTRQGDLVGIENRNPAQPLAAPPCGLQARPRPFADQFSVKFGKGGDHGIEEPAFGARRVDSGTLPRQRAGAYRFSCYKSYGSLEGMLRRDLRLGALPTASP